MSYSHGFRDSPLPRTDDARRSPWLALPLVAVGWVAFILGSSVIAIAWMELKLKDTTVMASETGLVFAAAVCIARGSWGTAIARGWPLGWAALLWAVQVTLLALMGLGFLVVLATVAGGAGVH